MRYSIEPRDLINVEGNVFIVFAKIMRKDIVGNLGRNLNNKYTK